MVSVQEAAMALARACRWAELDGAFTPATRLELTDAAERLPLSPEIRAWYSTSAPRDVAIPFDVVELTLFDPASLIAAQTGYRWRGNTGERLADWPHEWLAIGTIEGDAVIAHTDRPGTPISVAEHGRGSWEPRLVAPDLATYLTALTIWVEVVAGEYEGRVRTDDWECRVLPDARQKLDHQLAPLLADQYRQHWLPQD